MFPNIIQWVWHDDSEAVMVPTGPLPSSKNLKINILDDKDGQFSFISERTKLRIKAAVLQD